MDTTETLTTIGGFTAQCAVVLAAQKALTESVNDVMTAQSKLEELLRVHTTARDAYLHQRGLLEDAAHKPQISGELAMSIAKPLGINLGDVLNDLDAALNVKGAK